MSVEDRMESKNVTYLLSIPRTPNESSSHHRRVGICSKGMVLGVVGEAHPEIEGALASGQFSTVPLGF